MQAILLIAPQDNHVGFNIAGAKSVFSARMEGLAILRKEILESDIGTCWKKYHGTFSTSRHSVQQRI
jgi:hypothetical protein